MAAIWTTPTSPTASDESGELVDLVGDGHVGDHRPEERHALPDREQPVVAVAAQRPQVGRDGPPARRQPFGVGGGRADLGRGGGESFVGLRRPPRQGLVVLPALALVVEDPGRLSVDGSTGLGPRSGGNTAAARRTSALR